MPFRVTARTLLQLGSELISSDAIAFYELIKNAFDAGSKMVEINVVVCIPTEALLDLSAEIFTRCADAKGNLNKPITTMKQDDQQKFAEMQARILHRSTHIPVNARGNFRQQMKAFHSQVMAAARWDDLIQILEDSNYIEFIDKGEGMSLWDLDTVFLTIGTRSRLEQREQRASSGGKTNVAERPILGEKGLGRLSAVRLGDRLQVTTSKAGEEHYNILDIDWRLFSHASSALIEEIAVEPVRGPIKSDSTEAGTIIRVSNLHSDWTQEKLEAITRDEFSRLIDPFINGNSKPIRVRFNGDLVPLPDFDRILFELAHAVVDAQFDLSSDEPRLVEHMDYRLRKREAIQVDEGIDLLSIASTDLKTLRSLGPFHVKFYWFNRGILTAVEGIGERRQVQKLVNRWSGGLMLFRDGFRVNPYGSGENDWLRLDPAAFGSSGYKVNRSQIIGKVEISAIANPHLVDQTNREGLRDTPEQQVLIKLLRHLLLTRFRGFLNAVDAEVSAKEPLKIEEVEQRVSAQRLKVSDALRLLRLQVRGQPSAEGLLREIENEVTELGQVMNQIRILADAYDRGRSQLVHLAGIGLMVEIITHELSRSTLRTLNTLASSHGGTNASKDLETLLSTLEAQMKTLHKRLRVLDPLDTNTRQRKETFDLISWGREILQSHEDQFARHNIKAHFKIEPPRQNAVFRVTAVKGMIVQILENLVVL